MCAGEGEPVALDDPFVSPPLAKKAGKKAAATPKPAKEKLASSAANDGGSKKVQKTSHASSTDNAAAAEKATFATPPASVHLPSFATSNFLRSYSELNLPKWLNPSLAEVCLLTHISC